MTRLFILVALALSLSACNGESEGLTTVTTANTNSTMYRQTAASMEPTIHCAKPRPGCEATESDRFVAEAVEGSEVERGDIVLFRTIPQAALKCGASGTFVKRIIGLPGERVEIRIEGGAGVVYIDGEAFDEPYIEQDRRDSGPEASYEVPQGHYFVMGDNRAVSCDSRVWGSVPEENIVGRVTTIVRAG